MHESGLQGHPAGCPALVKAPASGHSSLLYDVKSTDLCYGYQSELTFTKGVIEGPSSDTHTHTLTQRSISHILQRLSSETHTHFPPLPTLTPEQAISTYAKGHICNAGDFMQRKRR